MQVLQDRTPHNITQVGFLVFCFLVPLYLILAENQREKNNLDVIAP